MFLRANLHPLHHYSVLSPGGSLLSDDWAVFLASSTVRETLSREPPAGRSLTGFITLFGAAVRHRHPDDTTKSRWPCTTSVTACWLPRPGMSGNDDPR